MQGSFVTSGGQAAVLAALAYAAQAPGRAVWMPAAELAEFVGAPGADDPEFEAVVRSLHAAGAIRLRAGGASTPGGKPSYRATLVAPV